MPTISLALGERSYDIHVENGALAVSYTHLMCIRDRGAVIIGKNDIPRAFYRNRTGGNRQRGRKRYPISVPRKMDLGYKMCIRDREKTERTFISVIFRGMSRLNKSK